MWEIEIYDKTTQNALEALPTSIKVHIYRIFELLECFGNEVKEPHTKSLGNGLFEIRAKGQEGIARVFFTYKKQKVIIVFHCFIKKSQKTPKNELQQARKILSTIKEQE